MPNFDAASYLVVKISDPLKHKNIGLKCIPARWAENALRDNYLIIRYPEEENSETRVQVKNKEPSKKTWPSYCALIMFRTDSYEKAIEFITEYDKQDTPIAADELPDNTMNETKASTSATPSTSDKRVLSEETYNDTTNEDSPLKKRRKSAIRSGNNLKMLIQNKMLHYVPKQKVSPKKVLSLQKQARAETLETLIIAGKFNKLDKLYSKTVAAETHGLTVNDDIISTDDSDSSNEPDKIPPPHRNILEPVLTNEPNPTNITKTPEITKTPLRETVAATDASDSNNETEEIPAPDRNKLEPEPRNEPNPTNTAINPGTSKTPLHETMNLDPTQISSTNNPDQLEKTKSYVMRSQSSLNADVSSLENRILNLAPEKGTEHQNQVDIKHIKDIYNSILEVKKQMNAFYEEKSIQLKKAFESINLFVPEIKRGLSLPTVQQLKENNRPNSDELTLVSSRQELPPQRKEPSSHTRTTPSLQQSVPSSHSESSSDSEMSSKYKCFSLSPKPSTFSKPECYVAKWTLKHQTSGPGLTELMSNSGIYVSEAELTRCNLLGTDMRNFARLLLPLIFSKEALSKCSYSDKVASGKHSRSKDKKPGLDEHARNVLIDYVNKHAKECGWPILSLKVMNQSLRDKLRLN